MRYSEVTFAVKAPDGALQDARDIVCALAGEAGFETFEDTADGVKGYVQQGLTYKPVLTAMLSDFPMEGVTVTFSEREAVYKDWNEPWEQQGFEPIVIKCGDSRGDGGAPHPTDGTAVVIHDGRHLPRERAISAQTVMIEIDARQAFGTGTHETTRLMVAALLHSDVRGRRVLDCGTGTGILAIAALKLGAAEAVGYDIDEWSTDNARHNAVINHVDERFTTLLGDASILNNVEGAFDIVMANINRNTLLADMPAMAARLADGGMMAISGFLTADVPQLLDRAADIGLTLEHRRHEGGWECLALTRRQPLCSHFRQTAIYGR